MNYRCFMTTKRMDRALRSAARNVGIPVSQLIRVAIWKHLHSCDITGPMHSLREECIMKGGRRATGRKPRR